MKKVRKAIGQTSAGLFVLVTAASLILVPPPSTAQAGTTTRATFTYSCCTASVVDATYHPGEVMRLPWISTALVPSTRPKELLTLSAKISGPFKTVASLKFAFARHTPQLGRINAGAVKIRVSSGAGGRYFSLLKVPRNATAGFYELTTSTTNRFLVTSEGAVIRVSKFALASLAHW